MRIIFYLLKKLIGLITLFVTLIGTFSALYVWLSKKGIIKSEWIIEKTPSGKGMRFVTSIRDKIFLSFQV